MTTVDKADLASAEAKAEPDRRQQILAAAAEIFFEKGYERACIDELIAKVGGSKRTIYNAFASKEGLFAAVVHNILTEHARRIHAIAASDAEGADLRQTVLDFARASSGIVHDPQMLALYRVLIAEGRRFPGLAQAFYAEGPSAVAAEFTKVLERHKARGEIRVADCHLAAEQFLGLVRDNHYLAVLLGVRETPPGAEMEIRLCALADLFLDGVATRAYA